MSVKKYIPALQWMTSYSKGNLGNDMVAGITVAVMLIPQGMAYAMIAGLPPIYGLYASTVPLIIYAFLGSSNQLAVGPVAMISLLVAAAVGNLATQGTDQFIQLTILLALMVGSIQLLMGIFKLGFLVNFISHPVISGFTSAAALIIGFSQLKHILGFQISKSHHIHSIIIDAFNGIGNLNWLALSIGISGIAVILLLKKWNRKIPGMLIAVALAILSTWIFDFQSLGVQILGAVPDGLPLFSIPAITFDNLQSLLPIAVTIALIAYMESIAVAKAIQSRHKDYEVSPNQELIALGMANIGGSFFQSYPTTGGFSRTAVNDQAGAKTGMATLITAIIIGLTLLFFTPLFYHLPKAILASVIMVAVFGLIDLKEARHLFKTDRKDFALLMITFIATLTLGIETGILVGVVLSLAMVIYESTRPHTAVLGRIKGTNYFKNISRYENLETAPNKLILRFDASIYYANSNYFKEFIEKEMHNKGEELKLIVLEAEGITSIDSTGMKVLEDIYSTCDEKKILLFFSGVKGPVRDIFHRTGFVDKVGKEYFFMQIQDAVDFFNENRLMIDPEMVVKADILN